MKAKYLIPILLMAGIILSGCVGEKPEESVPVEPQEPAAPPDTDVVSDELSDIEMDEIESELAELEALLEEIGNESDLMAEVDESTFA